MRTSRRRFQVGSKLKFGWAPRRGPLAQGSRTDKQHSRCLPTLPSLSTSHATQLARLKELIEQKSGIRGGTPRRGESESHSVLRLRRHAGISTRPSRSGRAGARGPHRRWCPGARDRTARPSGGRVLTHPRHFGRPGEAAGRRSGRCRRRRDRRPDGHGLHLEGQNLQDCDYLINYDIHWNLCSDHPGASGGSIASAASNDEIQLVNFWPTRRLNKYINLKNRVEARMALVRYLGDGRANILRRGSRGTDPGGPPLSRQQLLRLKDEVLDLGISTRRSP